ncbi:zonular occludens toxin domain-containing protein [Paenibacillus larvae]|uniref:zonular occludens toxin domain-containing protein n=1 Tax=Paenibacillus larvae TaxID=1464 RepID=UPI000169344F|nr:hypothetical protein [Paenibacillus larvae]MDT2277700.1 hypothetical protein [Paenibacillus larvae]MDT2277719.1 hypothetical protein [Paenibacillus larvae]
MNVIIFDGIMGSGKTLGCSILAKHFQLRSECALYSNYELQGATHFSKYEQFLDLANNKSSILCIDEGHTDVDSRNALQNTVKWFTHIIFYLRKLRTTMFFTTPNIENLDYRVRSVCNLYCRCYKDKDYFRYAMFDLQANKFLKEYKIKQDIAKHIGAEIYDTTGIVTPIEWPDDKKTFNDFITKLKNLNNNFQQDIALSAVTPSHVPTSAVS